MESVDGTSEPPCWGLPEKTRRRVTLQGVITSSTIRNTITSVLSTKRSPACALNVFVQTCIKRGARAHTGTLFMKRSTHYLLITWIGGLVCHQNARWGNGLSLYKILCRNPLAETKGPMWTKLHCSGTLVPNPTPQRRFGVGCCVPCSLKLFNFLINLHPGFELSLFVIEMGTNCRSQYFFCMSLIKTGPNSHWIHMTEDTVL